MPNKIYPTIWLTLLASFICIVPVRNAAAMTAAQYFSDANRLFRDDLYWASLLRYQQAGEAGMDTPILHYNAGVAHYRAKQYVRARDELLLALQDSSLRTATQYNLGLNAYELGEIDEALRWFRLARDQDLEQKIQRFAVIAISRIRDEQAKPDEFELRVAERERKREFTDLQIRVRMGFGNDDNAFQSPNRPYVDHSDPDSPVVVPEAKSGAFVPVSLSAKYLINSLKFEGFYVAYRLGGRYYQDKDLENANEYQHEVSFGSEYHQKEDNREREVRSAFKVSQHQETYFDPDNGLERDVDGVAIGDRLNYLRYGPELAFRQSYKRLGIGAKIKGQLWNYDTQLVIPEYDHEYFLLGLFAEYKFTSSSLFRVTVEGYSRRYGDRPSYDLDGQPRLGNPDLRYDYYSAKLTSRQRIFGSMWFGFDLERTLRIDQYLGYNSYTRDSASVEFHWSPGDRFNFEAKGTYRLYDYPNAFAFQNPLAARKAQESLEARIITSFRMTRSLSLIGEARYWATASNDTRIQYERGQFILGVRWEQ